MPRLIDRLLPTTPSAAREPVRAVQLFTSWQKAQEDPLTDFESFARGAYYSNGPVFSTVLVRMLMLSEAEFKFRTLTEPHRLFGNAALAVLERPWPNATTGELVARMEQHASLQGNAFVYLETSGPDPFLQVLRPDRVRIVSNGERVVEYLYFPNGIDQGQPVVLPPERVAHWSPIPDPLGHFRGMSWLTPVAREITADKKMSFHKEKYFDNAAVPGLVIKYDKTLSEAERELLTDGLARRHEGSLNAYRTMVVENGADVTVVGSNMEQASFDAIQAAGENRIASAGGVPPIVAGFKEGLQAATYSNYAQAMRRFADLTVRPLWRSLAASLSPLVKVPPDSKLWYDDSDIPALKQDALEEAQIVSEKARAADTLIRAGYEPDSVAAVVGLPAIPHTGGIPTTLYEQGRDPKAGTPKKKDD